MLVSLRTTAARFLQLSSLHDVVAAADCTKVKRLFANTLANVDESTSLNSNLKTRLKF